VKNCPSQTIKEKVETQSDKEANPANSSGGNNAGLIIGIVVAVLTIGLVGLMIYSEKKKKKSQSNYLEVIH
jgi:uncharacterized protein HemX